MNDALYLEAPPLQLTAEQERAFRSQWQALRAGRGYQARWPKHEFLRWLVATQAVVLHGSGRPDIDVFRPRDQLDYDAYPVHAVFATSDGLWPIYFAIADRRVVRSLINDCVHEDGTARYFFSVATEPAGANPWTTGTVYILPRTAFRPGRGLEWLSETPVRPLARLTIEPDEFPFLDAVFRHHPRESVAELEARLRSELDEFSPLRRKLSV